MPTKWTPIQKTLMHLLLIAFLISGCGYMKQTLLEVKGDDVNVPLGIGQSVRGKGLRAFIYRQVFLSFPFKKNTNALKNIKTTSETNNDAFSDSIDVTQ